LGREQQAGEVRKLEGQSPTSLDRREMLVVSLFNAAPLVAPQRETPPRQGRRFRE